MNKRLSTTILLCLGLLCTLTAMASTFTANAEKDAKTIYAFGFGETLNDTTVFLSPVQVLEGAETDKSGFLIFREEYATQLQQHLSEQYGKTTMCVLIYATSRDKAEKKYVRLRRELQRRPHTKLVEMPVNEFQFARRPE